MFGEHFVVHGVPGIASAVDSAADATVKKAKKGINVADERTGAKGCLLYTSPSPRDRS